MEAPCKDCPDRHYLCHSECEKYLAFRAERDKRNEKRTQEKIINAIVRKGMGETIVRKIKKKGRQ